MLFAIVVGMSSFLILKRKKSPAPAGTFLFVLRRGAWAEEGSRDREPAGKDD